MKNLNLENFEQDILDSVENEEWQSKGFLNNEKKKAVSIMLSESDLYELERKSLKNGVPY